MKTLVLYHGPSCWDGFSAAWVLRRKLGPDCDFIPVQYGQPAPDVTGAEVFILDFSYKRPVMIEMTRQAKKLVCLDHHETAREELKGLSAGSDDGLIRFDLTKSGGRLAWEYFFPDKPACWLVKYTEDRDLWRWQLRDSREINAALRSYPLDFAMWDRWDTVFYPDPPWSFMEQGTAILRAERQIIDAHVRNATEIELGACKVLAVNATTLISEIGQELARGKPFSATWFDRADGKRVWSLRSDENGIHVGDFAKRRGGGGHAHSAGYTE